MNICYELITSVYHIQTAWDEGCHEGDNANVTNKNISPVKLIIDLS